MGAATALPAVSRSMREPACLAHIAVIGAGITGVTTAYALLERGHK